VAVEDLKALREEARLSQAALAERSYLQQTTISALELGKVVDPRLSTLKGLARGLRMSPSRVLKALEESIRRAEHERMVSENA
jgi:transcriptional regulator with XRE-family HTH domain